MLNQNIVNFKASLKGIYTKGVKRYAGPYWYRRRWLEKTQWYSKEKLEAVQLELLKKMVRHSYETVPYYRQAMDEDGIKPDDVQSLSDIKKFRVISKDDVRRQGDRMYSKKYGKFFLKTAHTGGTTGLPVPIIRDIFSIGNEHAFVRRQFDWAGVGREKFAYLEGRVVKSDDGKGGGRHYYDAAMKELTLSTFHLTDETASEYAYLMRRYGVRVLAAYPSAAYVMARVCLERGIELPLKAVLTTAETLDDGKREIISRAFACKVFDFYGSAERVCYIQTCERGSYHIVPEYGLVELQPVESGEANRYRVIATGFWNKAMPLIRYDIKDIVELDEGRCSCGREFVKVKKIIGRDSDVITTPSGVKIAAAAIECILGRVLYGMYDMPVLAGRVVQESAERVILEDVPAEGFGQEHLGRLKAHFNEQLSGGLCGEVRSVNKIERTPGGKFLSFVMSEHH